MRAWHNGCALGFRPSIGIPIQLSEFDSRRPLHLVKGFILAKKLYAVPLRKALELVKEHKSSFRKLAQDRKLLEFYKLLGKSYYLLEIEKFIKFYKIDKDANYALKVLESFNSKVFIKELSLRLNFAQFGLEKSNIELKEFFYGYLYLMQSLDRELFEHFLEKLFIHYHIAFKANTSIDINFKEMAIAIAKNRKLSIKESFGESEAGKAFFKIIEDGKTVVNREGKSIKTLRKQAFKDYFYYLLD